jgi:hypothetical protein
VKGLGIFILILCGFLAPRCGATVYQSDGSAASVQGLHNAVLNGDTITLPAGTFTWTTPVHITKNITLQGAGVDSTVINDNIPKTGGAQSVPIYCENITGQLRLTGFTIHGIQQDVQQYGRGEIDVYGSSHVVRIDHVKFNQPGANCILIGGDIWGVIDHCTFINNNGLRVAVTILDPNYGGGSYGDVSFESPTALGSGQGIYIEDCNFIGTGNAGAGVTDATEGGRYVFRHNTVTSDNAATHGTEGQRYRGVRSYEFYNNTFRNPNSIIFCAIYLRGGTGVIWGNVFTGGGGQTGYRNGVVADNYRSWYTWQPWGRCDGTSPWDQNGDPTGYGAIDQVGRGMALDRVRGESPINQRTHNAAWPRNQSEPIYYWNNTLTPIPNNQGYPLVSNHPVIQVGRDMINGQMSGYRPYVYPHPLVTDAPAPTPTPSATPCSRLQQRLDPLQRRQQRLQRLHRSSRKLKQQIRRLQSQLQLQHCP